LILSIITPDASLRKTIERQLVGVEYEIIVDNWQKGFDESCGQFVCFLEKDSDFAPGHFVRGVLNMLIKPGYRKLAMVAPAVFDEHTSVDIYGASFHPHEDHIVQTHDRPASTEPYPVQIAFMPGAIIRRSAIEKHSPNLLDYSASESIVFSIGLWKDGNRVHLDPHMVYMPAKFNMGLVPMQLDVTDLQREWKKESIGGIA
jgi:hypothetical protein